MEKLDLDQLDGVSGGSALYKNASYTCNICKEKMAFRFGYEFAKDENGIDRMICYTCGNKLRDGKLENL